MNSNGIKTEISAVVFLFRIRAYKSSHQNIEENNAWKWPRNKASNSLLFPTIRIDKTLLIHKNAIFFVYIVVHVHFAFGIEKEKEKKKKQQHKFVLMNNYIGTNCFIKEKKTTCRWKNKMNGKEEVEANKKE